MDGSLTPVVCIIQNEFGTEWVIIEDPSEEEVGEEKKKVLHPSILRAHFS